MSDQAAAKPVCEHYWASHVHGGLSVRLCQLCHEPDWDDLRAELAKAAAAQLERDAQLIAAYHKLYDLWWNHVATVEIDRPPGYNGISYDDTESLGDAAEEIAALLRHGPSTGTKRPRIVCLCGSTRFYDMFRAANLEHTLAGEIVLSIGCDFRSDSDLATVGTLGKDPEQVKAELDELHKHKIDLADYVLVLNVGGYIGESTRSEIEYAWAHGKPVRYLEPPAALLHQGHAAGGDA